MPTNMFNPGVAPDRPMVALRSSVEAVARRAHRVLGGSNADSELAVLLRQIDHLQEMIGAIRRDDANLLVDLDRWADNLRRRVEGRAINLRLEVAVS